MSTLPGTNAHTRQFAKGILADASAFKGRTVEDINLNPSPAAPRMEHDKTLDLELAAEDDVPDPLDTWARAEAQVARVLPITDPSSRWKSNEEAQRTLKAYFPGLMRKATPWPDPMGDVALRLLVTQGIGAHLLERAPGGGFVVDIGWMRNCEMRKPFAQLGARLFLDDAYKPTGIELGSRTVLPTRGRAWEKAKLVFRSTLAAEATIVRHAVHCHFLVANCAVVAVRRSLRPKHALRRLMIPFQYRNPTINRDAALLLLPKAALFHRLFGFKWWGLKKVYAHAKAVYICETFPEELQRRGVADARDYPYGEDGLLFWNSVRAFVERYFDAVGLGEDVLTKNVGIQKWLQDLRAVSPTLRAVENRDDLLDLIAIYLFNATAVHEHAGGDISFSLSNIGFVVPGVRKGERLEDMFPSRNSMIQSYMLGVLTSYKMPSLLEDWSIAMLTPQAKQVVVEWLAELRELADTIEARNAQREQPCNTYNPRFLELSVSI